MRFLFRYSPTPGFNNYVGALRSRKLIEGDGDRLTITAAGIQTLRSWESLPTGAALIDYWRSRLGKAERVILETLTLVYPDPLTKEEVAAKAGYEANGSLELRQGWGRLLLAKCHNLSVTEVPQALGHLCFGKKLVSGE